MEYMRGIWFWILVPILISGTGRGEGLSSPGLPRRTALSKCSGDVSERFLEVPPFLQIKYPEPKLAWFREQLHPNYLYNFTLYRHDRKKQCGGDGAEFEVDILRYEDETVPSWFFFTPDGSLNYNREESPGTPEQEITYNINNYCISKITKGAISVRACKSTCGTVPEEKGGALCLRKCCTLGQVKTESGKCVDVDGPDWAPPLWSTFHDLGSGSPVIYPQLERANTGTWNCSRPNLVGLIHEAEDFRVMENGGVFWKKAGREHWKRLFPRLDNTKFCIDGFWNTSESRVYNPALTHFSMRCDLTPEEEYELKNSETDPVIQSKLRDYAFHHTVIFGIFLVTSLIFLFLMGLYAVLWSQQNVHGWTIFTFAAAEFLYNTVRALHAAWFAFGETGLLISSRLTPLCVIMGIILQFCIIACFSWTTILTFDVWAKIRSIRAQSRTYKGQKRFGLYCLAGFSVPLIWVLVAVTMEYGSGYEEHMIDDGLVRPGFRKACEVNTGSLAPYFIYVGLPILVLFLTNMVLASSTVKFIWDAKKNVASLSDSKSTSNTDNHVKLAVKLFVLMGIFLVVDSFQTFLNLNRYSVYWVFFETFRIIHALALAWIFVANGRILAQLRNVFPNLLRKAAASDSSSNTNTNATTRTTPKS